MFVRQGLHDWNLAPAEAARLQERLAASLSGGRLPSPLRLVAGVDLALSGRDSLVAAAVVWSPADSSVVEVALARKPLSFPYVPGLLSFREAPAALEALASLRSEPDLVIFDGQGIAHPRGLGLAAHLGLWLEVPTVGAAKKRLCGTHRPVRDRRGSKASLFLGGRRVGFVLRTRPGVKPLYVSPGNRIGPAGAARAVLRCCRGFRLPEPTRLAHIAAAMAKRGLSASEIERKILS